ncbi:aminodeoxychorismate synthase component I [Halobacillus rhizosphaerae]|uniref:aminodeoxychorismate synthase component I n=1 Tax=Halobacillus rhizosphaerae TaxID=3064889 RepID=UPI00398A68CF
MNPLMVFDFADDKGNNQQISFEKPISVVTANSLSEVKTAFHEVEKQLAKGNYAAGFVSYEAAPAFDRAFRVHKQSEWPLVWFGIFDEPVEELKISEGEYQLSQWEMEGTFADYQTGMKKIKEAIEVGNTYQVNYTTRLRSHFKGNAYSFYKQLSKNQQAQYSAFLQLGNRSILSASPELFFKRHGNQLTAKPMKGTAKRGRWAEEDKQQMDHLVESEKERAENLMIVDLLRNDLGRVAVPGSIHVPKLFEIETYPTVHQMTSTVNAALLEETSILQIFQALFPCGSITGAPKVRTMEYIAALETSARNIYCGAVGYITPTKEAVFNVPIRTVMIDHRTGEAVYGTGGGVTWDSTPEAEFHELQTKAKFLTEKRPEFDLLETMKLEEGQFPLLEYHLNRAGKSSAYFNRPFNDADIRIQTDKLASEHPQGVYKVRLLLDAAGDCKLTISPISEPPLKVKASLASEPVNEHDVFLFHKTTHRQVYNRHNRNDVFTVLLWNQKNELTEFTMANLVVKHQGEFYTPPVTSGLLAGTYRERLLEEGFLKERKLNKEDLGSFEEIWMINGVRGWVRVEMV